MNIGKMSLIYLTMVTDGIEDIEKKLWNIILLSEFIYFDLSFLG